MNDIGEDSYLAHEERGDESPDNLDTPSSDGFTNESTSNRFSEQPKKSPIANNDLALDRVLLSRIN